MNTNDTILQCERNPSHQVSWATIPSHFPQTSQQMAPHFAILGIRELPGQPWRSNVPMAEHDMGNGWQWELKIMQTRGIEVELINKGLINKGLATSGPSHCSIWKIQSCSSLHFQDQPGTSQIFVASSRTFQRSPFNIAKHSIKKVVTACLYSSDEPAFHPEELEVAGIDLLFGVAKDLRSCF